MWIGKLGWAQTGSSTGLVCSQLQVSYVAVFQGAAQLMAWTMEVAESCAYSCDVNRGQENELQCANYLEG